MSPQHNVNGLERLQDVRQDGRDLYDFDNRSDGSDVTAKPIKPSMRLEEEITPEALHAVKWDHSAAIRLTSGGRRELGLCLSGFADKEVAEITAVCLDQVKDPLPAEDVRSGRIVIGMHFKGRFHVVAGTGFNGTTVGDVVEVVSRRLLAHVGGEQVDGDLWIPYIGRGLCLDGAVMYCADVEIR